MDAAIGAFIRGQGIVCLVLGTIYTVGLTLIDLQYGLLIGIATGVMSFVPVVGTVLGLITASIVAVIQGWPDLTLLGLVVLIFGIGQALDAGFLSPRVVGPKVGLHPVALIFALFVFSYLFGFVGVLVAVPMAAAIGVLIRFGLRLYLASPIYKGGGQDEVEAEAGRVPLPGGGENDKA
jgi:predicted PurR-regulated permease PerM